MAAWEAKCPANVPPTDQQKSIQQSWDKPLLDVKYANLLANASDERSKARILGVSSKSAGAWLTAIPLPSLGLKLPNDQLRIVVGLRVGATICSPFKCKCGSEVDSAGVHALSCRFNAGRLARHSQANDIIRRALISAGIPSILEPQGLCRTDGKRPDGATLIPWAKGRSLLWDFTCSDTLATSNLPLSHQEHGTIASKAEERKRKKYEELAADYHFCPIGVETMGALGRCADHFIKTVGQKIVAATGDDRATAFLRQRISMAIQRGNAISVLSCMPKYDGLNELSALI